MMKSLSRIVAVALLFVVSSLATTVAQIRDDAPSSYTVKSGDTLWHISARFLNSPWMWPEVWHANPQISNPHLIYPGDDIVLVYRDGRPRLEVSRGVVERQGDDGVVRLSPRVRELANDEAIPAIPMSAIEHYLRQGMVVTREQIEQAPSIIGGADRRVLFGRGDVVYGRDRNNRWEDAHRRYGIYRVGERYIDPDTNSVLGHEALMIGEVELQQLDGDVAIFHVLRSSEDIRAEDRLMPVVRASDQAMLYPSAPAEKVSGRVIRFFDRINNIARNDVAVIGRGSEDGLKVGNVLDVFTEGEVVRDRVVGDRVKLPSMRTGSIVVFKVFDRVSYGLVMESTRPIFMHDVVESPAGSY